MKYETKEFNQISQVLHTYEDNQYTKEMRERSDSGFGLEIRQSLQIVKTDDSSFRLQTGEELGPEFFDNSACPF